MNGLTWLGMVGLIAIGYLLCLELSDGLRARRELREVAARRRHPAGSRRRRSGGAL